MVCMDDPYIGIKASNDTGVLITNCMTQPPQGFSPSLLWTASQISLRPRRFAQSTI
jgi:hypothetical protein